MGADVALKPVYTFQHCTNAPHIPSKIQALNWELITSWMVPLLFSLEDGASLISKNIANLNPCDHRTVFHFVSVHFNLALVQRRWQCSWIMFTFGFFFTWKPAFVDWHGVHRQSFLEVFLSPCSDFQDRIVFFIQGTKITRIKYWFSAMSLAHRDVSRFAKSFDDTMYCR